MAASAIPRCADLRETSYGAWISSTSCYRSSSLSPSAGGSGCRLRRPKRIQRRRGRGCRARGGGRCAAPRFRTSSAPSRRESRAPRVAPRRVERLPVAPRRATLLPVAPVRALLPQAGRRSSPPRPSAAEEVAAAEAAGRPRRPLPAWPRRAIASNRSSPGSESAARRSTRSARRAASRRPSRARSAAGPGPQTRRRPRADTRKPASSTNLGPTAAGMRLKG